MSAVGLIYVGAVLVVNGVMLLGFASGRAVAPLNLFVGVLQVVTPTVLILQAGPGGPGIFAASGLYLFGFTYLWVAINSWHDLPGHGLGWFSLFVAACAVAYSLHAFTVEGDPAFGVIWLMWAGLWAMFFVLLGLDRASWGPATGVVALVEGVATAAVPGWLLAAGLWPTGMATAVVLAVIGVAMFVLAAPVGRMLSARAAARSGAVAAA